MLDYCAPLRDMEFVIGELIGFEKIQIGKIGINTHTQAHYLHHKFFECNYADGAVPLDKYFGTFHDGSEEAQERMIKRYNERMKKMRTA